MTPKIIAVYIKKGGQGKTVTSVNLAYELSQRGKKVLLIDLDESGNATSYCGFANMERGTTLFLEKPFNIEEVESYIWKSNGFFVMPSNDDLEYISDIREARKPGRERILSKKINELLEHFSFDFIILDCPPSGGFLAHNAIVVAKDGIIVPYSLSDWGLSGIAKVLNGVTDLVEVSGIEEPKIGLLTTFYENRRVIGHYDKLISESEYGELVFKTRIRRNIAVQESVKEKEPLSKYKPKCPAAVDYHAFCGEFLEWVHG